MTEGFTQLHWAFVAAAYSVTGVGLGGLIIYIVLRLWRWEKRARKEGCADA